MGTSYVDHGYSSIRREHMLRLDHVAFTRALESLLGTMEVGFLHEIANGSPEAGREKLASFVGPSDLALFQKIDHGTLLTALYGRATRATTYVFGNALIAVEMTRHVPRVGLYVPPRLFVYEVEPGRIAVTYDVPSVTFAQFGSPQVDAIAMALDQKVEQLIADAARLAEERRAT